jgi:thiol-disulfide isomerase/thioredoxin
VITSCGRAARNPTIKPHTVIRRLLAAPALVLVVSACSTSPQQTIMTGPHAAPCPQRTGRQIAGFPDQRLRCLTGPGSLRVSVSPGRPEVINVWASWCYPCRQEIDLLERAHRRLGNRVAFLGVDEKDRPAAAIAFLDDHLVGYPQVSDPDGGFAHALGFSGVPDTIAVDAAGHVVFRYKGQLTATALDDLLGALGVSPQR